jgi:hypothetical protein
LISRFSCIYIFWAPQMKKCFLNAVYMYMYLNSAWRVVCFIRPPHMCFTGRCPVNVSVPVPKIQKESQTQNFDCPPPFFFVCLFVLIVFWCGCVTV